MDHLVLLLFFLQAAASVGNPPTNHGSLRLRSCRSLATETTGSDMQAWQSGPY